MLIKPGEEDDEYFSLDWKLWMGITHADLMKFHLAEKLRDNRNDKWDREHFTGKYKRKSAPDNPHWGDDDSTWAVPEEEYVKVEYEDAKDAADDDSFIEDVTPGEPERKPAPKLPPKPAAQPVPRPEPKPRPPPKRPPRPPPTPHP